MFLKTDKIKIFYILVNEKQKEDKNNSSIKICITFSNWISRGLFNWGLNQNSVSDIF